MAGLPPLRNLRKTTVIFIVVFLSFLTHRFIDYVIQDSAIKDAGNTELTKTQGVVCRHIVKEMPFGVDSVFEEGTRLYFYTTLSNAKQFAGDTLLHVWYHGMDTVLVVPCSVNTDKETCYTEIAPTLAIPGEWSVDLVVGRRLLVSQQFSIDSIGR